jgi:hypothetical protein
MITHYAITTVKTEKPKPKLELQLNSPERQLALEIPKGRLPDLGEKFVAVVTEPVSRYSEKITDFRRGMASGEPKNFDLIGFGKFKLVPFKENYLLIRTA